MATKKTTKATPRWSDVNPKLADFDRTCLLRLAQDLYAASKDNKEGLPAAQQATFVARLDRVRQLGQNVGWGVGVGDDFDHFWMETGLAGEE